MAEARGCGSGTLEAEGGAGTGRAGEEWPLRRYGRFRPDTAEPGGAGEGNAAMWRVFESNEESGNLTLNIMSTGHFFICQGHTLLIYIVAVEEGFSLIAAQTWLKVGRKSDCLLFGSKARQESRMFRVQFSGEPKEKALEICESCVQKLQYYVPVQTGSLGESSQSVPEERISITQLAQSVLNPQSGESATAHQHTAMSTAELGPFLKLCLLDQHFPAFVEAVEKELRKVTEG
ncbi:meiotic recombination protein REC114 isoform X2 [Ascaphus truei]|uniref:meiotic recombination protein REC114 isoform X2 n=1 Tax=Ascaphus truei TaxID=8439 RepID=UPI003F597B0A